MRSTTYHLHVDCHRPGLRRSAPSRLNVATKVAPLSFLWISWICTGTVASRATKFGSTSATKWRILINQKPLPLYEF